MPRPPADTSWRAEPGGPPRTTHAGRLAIPVILTLGGCTVAVVDLILDGPRAEQLFAVLNEHLAGRGIVAGAVQ